ncbi:MAG: PilN domain-containing protein [Eubacteriales bacterium]|nr:PilN domain-containing protein [Eubacteriales bacterium]
MNPKRDINLLPERQGPSQGAKTGAMFATVGLVLAALCVTGILVPNGWLATVSLEKKMVDTQAAQYASVEQEFDDITAQMEAIQGQLAMVSAFREDPVILNGVLQTLEDCAPQEITLLTLHGDYEKMTITGTAPDDGRVAAMAAKLRRSGAFAAVSVDTTQSEQKQPTQEGDVAVNYRMFTMTMTYAAAAQGNAETGAATAEGSDGQ